MPFCSKCGKDIYEGSQFCPHCGNNIAHSGQGYFSDHNTIREGDYIAFVGNNADKYMRKFKSFTVGGIDNFALTWHWPAFLFGFWWMLYRKIYPWALLAFITACIPYVGFAGMIAWGITGNYIYYKHASSKIRALREMQSSADLSVTLSQIGGVNRWVVWAAVIIAILGAIFMILATTLSLFTGMFNTKESGYYM